MLSYPALSSKALDASEAGITVLLCLFPPSCLVVHMPFVCRISAVARDVVQSHPRHLRHPRQGFPSCTVVFRLSRLALLYLALYKRFFLRGPCIKILKLLCIRAACVEVLLACSWEVLDLEPFSLTSCQCPSSDDLGPSSLMSSHRLLDKNLHTELLLLPRGAMSIAKGSDVRSGVPLVSHWCLLVSAAFAWQAWDNVHC